MLEKGAKKEEIHCKDQVCQASVPSNKEGWRATTSDQPEKIQHIHILQTFQDGRTPSIKGNFGTRRLSMDLKDAYFCVPLNNSQGNMYLLNGRVSCTNSFACVLDLVQLQVCLQN